MSSREGLVRVAGAQLYFRERGKGTPVIVLHGGPGFDHTMLLPQFDELAQNHRVILYDQRGCGRSTGAVDPSTINLEQYVEDLEGLRQGLSLGQTALVGFSFGGLVAMKYITEHTESVSRLVLLDSLPAREKDLHSFVAILNQRTSAADQAEIAAIGASDEFASGQAEALNRYWRLRFKNYFFDGTKSHNLTVAFSDETGKNCLLVGKLMSEAMAGWNLVPELAGVDVPTLIVNGEYDPISPEAMTATIGAFKRVKASIVKGAGHFPYVELPNWLTSGEVQPFLRGDYDDRL